MSAQFGKCSLDGSPLERGALRKVRQLVAPYGPDAEGSFNSASAAILFRAFHTTSESERELEPYVSAGEVVVTWDGRLDNREELMRGLSGEVSSSASDLALAAAAYERWGTDCFRKLIGDWAIAIWSQRERALTLARDFIGTRHLYYWIDRGQAAWSTILDPLLLAAGGSLALDEEYIAGWLASLPAATLTPFAGIHVVPPSHFVVLQSGRTTIHKYWEFDPAKTLGCRGDEEFEERFREAFSRSVARRLRSNRPVLAELSGGIDSSSIVCIADEILAQSRGICSRLDTISYYDDSQPNWNERPYFSIVEGKRGATGFHIDVSQSSSTIPPTEVPELAATPAHTHLWPTAGDHLTSCVSQNGNRVLLSGIGGDEVTGGVPSPVPELADLLMTGQWKHLAQQLKSWSLQKRRPWLHLLGDTASRFLPGNGNCPYAPWVKREFIDCHRDAFHGYARRLAVRGARPSFQENIFSLEALRRQLACTALEPEPLLEKRYPFLDRDLLELLFAIPREQLLRPGERRSLIRRAMATTVPTEVLHRKRKAYVSRVSESLLRLCEQLFKDGQWISSSLGIIDCQALRQSIEGIRQLQAFPVVPLTRTLTMELWLRSLQRGCGLRHPANVANREARFAGRSRHV